MTIAETIKTLRKTAGMSQEQLAEKLHVSRQAVTKWETEGGTPDIENLRAVAALFSISIDELVSGEAKAQKTGVYLYESVTEYDIDEVKHYDMKFGSAKEVFLSGHPGEKLRVRLVSNTLASLQSDFKIKLDDTKRRLDLELLRKNGMSESASKEGLSIYAELPAAYLGKVECAVNAELVSICSLDCERIELGGRNRKLILDAVPGTVEIDSNLDMEIRCRSLPVSLELNQLSACSRVYVPADAVFSAKVKGIGTRISYANEGKATEPFDTPDAEKRIELNGIKSELVMMNGIVGGNTHRALDISEFRAFTLIDAYAPLIFINAADSESGRVFSLLHEFVHIGLGRNSFFNAREGEMVFVRPEETLCNAVAAELLVPRPAFCSAWENTEGTIERKVQELSKYFKCSQSVIARRALDEAYLTEEQYRELIAKATMLAKKARGGGGDYYRTQLSRMDHRFLQALDASVQEGKTLYTEAFRLTNTNRVTFDKLLEKVQGERV